MESLGSIAAIWRYPYKSLAAEALDEAVFDAGGIPGDRGSALFVESGHARAGKAYRGKEDRLLHTTPDPQRAVALAAQRNVSVQLRSDAPDGHYFDAAPVSLIFDAWIAQVERALEKPLDPRRWRPNLFVCAASGFAYGEEELLGAVLEAGGVRLRAIDTIKRCVTTTYDVETGEPDNDVLLYVAQKRANVMGIYCEVEVAGTLRAGDALRLRAR